MSELFPFFGDADAVKDNMELPLYKEVAWNFDYNVPILKNGEYYIVTENEAIKTWCYKALKTERFRYLIYSWNFGSELEDMIGKSYTPNLTKAESIRYIEECLLINPYIKRITGIEIQFDKGKLDITGTIETIYGDTQLEVRV